MLKYHILAYIYIYIYLFIYIYIYIYVTRPRDASATSHPTNATRRNHFSIFFIFHENHKKYILKTLFHIFFTRKGTLTLTPGMGVGSCWGTIQDPTNLQICRKSSSYENCSHFWDNFQKMSKVFQNIFMYTEKDTESDKRIQNNN